MSQSRGPHSEINKAAPTHGMPRTRARGLRSASHVAGGRCDGATEVGSSGVAHFIYGKSKVLSVTKKKKKNEEYMYKKEKREGERGRETSLKCRRGERGRETQKSNMKFS